MAVLDDDADAEAVDVIEPARDESVTNEMIDEVFRELDLPLGEEISTDTGDGA